MAVVPNNCAHVEMKTNITLLQIRYLIVSMTLVVFVHMACDSVLGGQEAWRGSSAPVIEKLFPTSLLHKLQLPRD